MTELKATPTASDFMETKLVTVRPSETLAEVVQQLLTHKVSNVPVVEDVAGKPRLVGFISEADCMEHMANELFYGNPAPHLTAELIMKRHPVCVAPNTNVFALASVFVSHRLRHLPVVEDERLVGIVSRRDVLKAMDNYYQELSKQRNKEKNPANVRELINHRFIMQSYK